MPASASPCKREFQMTLDHADQAENVSPWSYNGMPVLRLVTQEIGLARLLAL